MDYMISTNIFGWLGGILTLGYNIPQIYKNYKTKSINDISQSSMIIRLISYSLYILHSWIKLDTALFYTYLAGLIQILILNLQICWYKSNCVQQNETRKQNTELGRIKTNHRGVQSVRV